MVVRVDGKDYVVKRAYRSSADVLLANGSTHTNPHLPAPVSAGYSPPRDRPGDADARAGACDEAERWAGACPTSLCMLNPRQPSSLRLRLDHPHHRRRVRRRRRPKTDRRRRGQGQRARSVRRAGPAAQTPCPTRRPRLRGPPKATRTTLLGSPACHRLALGSAGRCPRSEPTSAGQQSTRRSLPCSNRASPRGQSRSWSTELTLTPPLTLALTRTTDPSPDPDPKPGSNAHSDCKRRGGTRGSAQRTQAAWAHPARRAADQGAAPRAEHGAEAPAARSRWANGGSRPRRPPRSQLAAALQLAGTAREDSARLRRTEPPALWTL